MKRLAELERIIADYFEREGWTIERDGDRIEAVQGSGYGSGPVVVDIRSLTRVVFNSEAAT